MKVCRTPGCPTLIPSDAYKGRCPACNRQASRDRGTRAEQGYGAEHRAERKAIAKRIASGELVTCWRCHEAITSEDDWDLGHDDYDRTITRGPEHARRCNRSAAGRASHGLPPRGDTPRG